MNQPKKITGYILAWGLWAVSSALGIFIAFWAVLDAIKSIAEGATMRGYLYGTPAEQFRAPFIRNAVDRFAILALGVLCVLLVVAIEHFYRTGLEQGQLWRRVVLVTTIEFGVLAVSLAVQSFVMGALGLITIWSIALPGAALVIASALAWVLTRMPRGTASG